MLQRMHFHRLLCVDISTNKHVSKRPSLLLKTPLRSLEADRTEKGSLGSHELSYLMDPSQGLLGCGPSTDEMSSFLMMMQKFDTGCTLRGSKIILKYSINSVVLL